MTVVFAQIFEPFQNIGAPPLSAVILKLYISKFRFHNYSVADSAKHTFFALCHKDGETSKTAFGEHILDFQRFQ